MVFEDGEGDLPIEVDFLETAISDILEVVSWDRIKRLSYVACDSPNQKVAQALITPTKRCNMHFYQQLRKENEGYKHT